MPQGGVVEAIVRGDRLIWLLIAALWLLTAALVAFDERSHRRAGHTRVFALLMLASATSIVGLAVSDAMAIPRIRWKAADEPALVFAGGDTWRRLTGPAVQIDVGGGPEVALPSVDAEGRWVLYGLLSGEPIPGFPAAEPAPPQAGATRVCDGGACRAWPAAWPKAEALMSTADLVWARSSRGGALAYDEESGLYVSEIVGLDGLEISGSPAAGAARSGRGVVFVVRRVAQGRLDSARVVVTPAEEHDEYRLERARVSLSAGPWAQEAVARPLLFGCLLALPLSLMAYLLAPVGLRARLGRRAVLRTLTRPVVLVPLGEGPPELGLAMSEDDMDLGDALLPRGTLVALGPGAVGRRPVASRAWFELPVGEGAHAEGATVPVGEGAHAEEATVGSAVFHATRGAPRKVGVLVPADARPFAVAARAWMLPHAHAAAVLVLGISLAAPGVVAVVSLLGSG